MAPLVALWLGWCCLHSLLICATVQGWIQQRGGLWAALYRLGYVSFSLLTLLPLLWCTREWPQHLVVSPSTWLWVLQGLLWCYALILFLGGLRVYDLRLFLGLGQWRAYRTGQASDPPTFTTRGILRYVRHPWYSGGIALLWALPELTDISLMVRLLLSAYLLIGAFLEERKLIAALGEPYQAYRRTTPMLLPWKPRS